MLKLTAIFRLLLFVSISLTSKVFFAQSVNTQISSTHTYVINPSSHRANYDDLFVFEDNDTSENIKIFSHSSFANDIKSYCYDFGLLKKEFAKIFLQKIPIPLHRLTHLFIFFHCWKFLFS